MNFYNAWKFSCLFCVEFFLVIQAITYSIRFLVVETCIKTTS